jgi:hypothetical protein
MLPMGLIYTQSVTYDDVEVEDIDLYEDAWGLNAEFTDVINLLGELDIAPGDMLTQNLMDRVRKMD